MKKTGTYHQLKDGDIIEIDKEGEVIRFSCCDCGLTHKFAFAIEESGNIGMMVVRDNRSTGQLRRYNEYEVDRNCRTIV